MATTIFNDSSSYSAYRALIDQWFSSKNREAVGENRLLTTFKWIADSSNDETSYRISSDHTGRPSLEAIQLDEDSQRRLS